MSQQINKINNDNNSQHNIKFVRASNFTEPNSVEKRGQWSEQRKLAAIEGNIAYCPFNQKFGMVSEAWNLVFDGVNRVDTELKALGPTAIKNYLKKARQDINKENIKSSNDFEAAFKDRLSYMNDLMTVAEAGQDKKKAYAPSERIKRRREAQAEICSQSLKGLNKKRKENKREIKSKCPQRYLQQNVKRDLYIIKDNNQPMKSSTKQRPINRKLVTEKSCENNAHFPLAKMDKYIECQDDFLNEIKDLIRRGKEETIEAIEASQKKFTEEMLASMQQIIVSTVDIVRSQQMPHPNMST